MWHLLDLECQVCNLIMSLTSLNFTGVLQLAVAVSLRWQGDVVTQKMNPWKKVNCASSMLNDFLPAACDNRLPGVSNYLRECMQLPADANTYCRTPSRIRRARLECLANCRCDDDSLRQERLNECLAQYRLELKAPLLKGSSSIGSMR